MWFPPGEWIDAWNGSRVHGPTTCVVSQPYERLPLWHRAGGFVVLSDDRSQLSGGRVMKQDWSELAIEAFAGSSCHATPLRTTRQVVERDYVGRTEVTLVQEPLRGCDANVTIRIGDGASRGWTIRLHLGAGQRAADVLVDGRAAEHRLLTPNRAAGMCSRPTTQSTALIIPPADARERASRQPFGTFGRVGRRAARSNRVLPFCRAQAFSVHGFAQRARTRPPARHAQLRHFPMIAHAYAT